MTGFDRPVMCHTKRFYSSSVPSRPVISPGVRGTLPRTGSPKGLFITNPDSN